MATTQPIILLVQGVLSETYYCRAFLMPSQ